METYYSSIFNEVFGPVMVGTSSSHTAGPYRIGAMARMLLKDPVKKGRISFDPNSSYASYYKLQWSDRGFVAGLLGLAIDSENMTDSLKIAEEKGVAIDFVIEEKDNKEPNYAYLDLESENGFKLKLGTTSIGGGAIEIIEIDGYPICIRGDFNTLFLYVNDKVDEVKKSAEQIIGGQCTVKELKKDAECLLCIETREFLKEDKLAALEQIENVVKVRYTEHVLPVLSQFVYEGIPFSRYWLGRCLLMGRGIICNDYGDNNYDCQYGKPEIIYSDLIISLFFLHIFDALP